MTEEVKIIPCRVIKMLFLDGYFNAFWLKVQDGRTHVKAYEETEKELSFYGLPNRYTNYESFKAAKYRLHTKDLTIRYF